MEEEERKTLISLYLEKSDEALYDAEMALENMRLSNCANRLYYALFYTISALFVADEIQISSHAGLKTKFGLCYVKTGEVSIEDAKIFSQMATLRERADYNCVFKVSYDEISEKMPRVKHLISIVKEIVNNK